jgi:aldehyde dehydrogenase (NAD+)
VIDHDKLYIDGAWTPATSDERIQVENPTTGEVIGSVPAAGPADVDRAVAAARAAFPAWSARPARERADFLRKLHDGLAARQSELSRTISTEMGAPVRIADKIQTQLPISVIAGFADLVTDYPFETTVGNSLVVAEPVGVVAAITPWNYPLHQIVAKIAPALAAGCTVVCKPSEIAPLIAYQLFEAIHEAGFPPGVINLVPGYGPVVGEALATHPDVDMVSLTGSTRAGRRVAELAGRSVKKVALELGGKSANVVLPDADLKLAVKVGVANAFLNSGQTCTAWTRLLVPADQYDEALELAAGFAETYTTGDPLDAATKLGPLVSEAQRTRVRGYIDTAVAEGARIVTGGAEAPAGQEAGWFVQPTVLADVAPDSTVAQEEIFGPVLSVIPFADEEEALDIANNSQYGLHGAVWSATQERALAFAKRMQTGTVDVNGGRYNPLAPFGGYKQSGVGREMGEHGLGEFLHTKAIQL